MEEAEVKWNEQRFAREVVARPQLEKKVKEAKMREGHIRDELERANSKVADEVKKLKWKNTGLMIWQL